MCSGDSQLSRIISASVEGWRRRSLNPEYSGNCKKEALWLNSSSQTGWVGVGTPAPRAGIGSSPFWELLQELSPIPSPTPRWGCLGGAENALEHPRNGGEETIPVWGFPVLPRTDPHHPPAFELSLSVAFPAGSAGIVQFPGLQHFVSPKEKKIRPNDGNFSEQPDTAEPLKRRRGGIMMAIKSEP